MSRSTSTPFLGFANVVMAAAPRTGVTAEAHCYKLTRSIAFVRAEAWDLDRSDLIATAQAAFVLNRAPA